ncbi:MAG: 30S ribosomal protein S16 [Bdellovibrionales bacterium]|nr:30S ribosomal protein S16 [Bdellovibrionales bacterium]
MVTIRLSRHGMKRVPLYKVVVADRRSGREGRVIEYLGNYDPKSPQAVGVVKKDRVEYWISKGAQPTQAVSKLLKRINKQTVAA